ncbi:MAG: polysaccharide deacetylase family protein [Candidatus Borkfalkiaceae bacterium]|nr:polysaccharide deacetylase family protein [Christensenellaceae bacterium]
MKKKNRAFVNAFTAVVLAAVCFAVACVCFIPVKTVSLSGGESYAPVRHGDRNGNCVSLMINVYEGADLLPGFFDVLKKYGAKCTFFVGGCWADDHADLLVRMKEEGHEIGNHGFFHKDHKKLSEKGNSDEISFTEAVVRQATGVRTALFAPPSGSYSVTTLKIAEKLGYKTVLWSKDTVDWRDKSKRKVYNRATENIEAGDFILMHPKAHTLEALPDILERYRELGLRAVTVSEALGETGC